MTPAQLKSIVESAPGPRPFHLHPFFPTDREVVALPKRHFQERVHREAAVGRADYFLTCDDRLVRRAGEIQVMLAGRSIAMTALNPIAFTGLLKATGGERA